MIKIAYCDDDISTLNELGAFLNQYRLESKEDIECAAFQSPMELLAKIEKGVRFDIIFLDIIMPGENGLKAATEIRNLDKNVKIVFLTSSDEFAVESYAVGAFYYQIKPFSKERFFKIMDSAISACEKERAKSLLLRCKDGITRIELDHLEYCEVIHHTLFIYLTCGKVLECSGSLDDLCQKLEACGQFFRPHRSFFVNFEFVEQISYKAITMSSSAMIPIPRGKYHDIKDAYLEYAFKNRQVIV